MSAKKSLGWSAGDLKRLQNGAGGGRYKYNSSQHSTISWNQRFDMEMLLVFDIPGNNFRTNIGYTAVLLRKVTFIARIRSTLRIQTIDKKNNNETLLLDFIAICSGSSKPIPTYVLSSELQMLRDELAAGGVDVILLDTWYKKDSNAVPPVSVLQPISSILLNFNNKRVPKLQAEDQAIWWDTLGKMQKLKIITEREVINGVLNVKNTKNHCLAYVRYINNINLQNLKKASNFVDILNRSLDAEASKLLADLRDVHSRMDRSRGAMRKEDSSAQGQIVTEILQHLHACNNSVKVFHGREPDLNFIEDYMKNTSDKPLSSAMSLDTWFGEVRPTNIIRFLGTTPDSSALTPTLISICQQISYNFALPFETIPDDLVPLTAHFKQLLTMATKEQPLLLFLDSVDQLTGIGTENNKVSWLPTRLPAHCKIIVTCACEEANPDVSKEYDVLRRMIDSEENFLEVKALGEDLAMQVLKLWMAAAARDLSNYQWRLVSNAIGQCSLPIFVKLVFAEFGELPFHLVRSKRFTDLYAEVLFNYEWIHAKLNCCPLQAVLADFEDAKLHVNKDEAPHNPAVSSLLKQCHDKGKNHCALLPSHHCLHTPGGPLKYSLEGHQFAVFAFRLSSDKRYVVSISSRVISWDLSTSDLARDLCPQLEGIMQNLELSPDNKWAAASTNNSVSILLNMLTSEYVTIENPLDEAIEMIDLENLFVVMWSGDLDDDRLLVHFCKDSAWVSAYELNDDKSSWVKVEELHHQETDTAEAMLQLKRGKKDRMLLATTTYSFVVWDFNNYIPRVNHESNKPNIGDDDENKENGDEEEPEKDLSKEGIVLKLPHTIRNISTKMTLSNSFMISKNYKYAVAGVRKNLYVWSLETTKLIKVLDAHFGRIVQLEPLTVGTWNNVITSSIDRTVKIWNIDNIFEQVHKIDRQELPIESISLARDKQLAVTVTRSCWGLWDTSTGKLLAQLADAPLGAIVTHASITPSGENVITAESGNVVIWDVAEKQVLFKEEQKGIKQLLLLEDGTKLITISMHVPTDNVDNMATAHIIARMVPGYKQAVVSADEHHIVAPGVDKTSKECLHIFHARTGARLHRIAVKNSGVKDMQSIVALPHKPHWVGVVGNDKAGILDIKTKRHVRFVPRWNGACTRDGKTGLCAPTRGGLDLIELKRGTSVQQLISRAAEGVFSIITMFSSTDDYVFYYHSGRKTLRIFSFNIFGFLKKVKLKTVTCAVFETNNAQVPYMHLIFIVKRSKIDMCPFHINKLFVNKQDKYKLYTGK
ncbi:unnamed protein product, partial [Leptidea sinapis]